MKATLISLCVLVLSVGAFAGTPILEGTVKGADVKIEPRSGAYFSKTIKTDGNGHYISSALAVGVYKVTLIVNGTIKASILNASTNSTKPTQLNFDLKTARASVKTHMVFVPADIGTHIGGGRWVEVDEQGNPVDSSYNQNIQTMNSEGVQQMQRNGLGSRSPTGQ